MDKEKNLDNILEKIKHNKTRLKNFGVLKLGIFGSYLRGEEKPDSDLDILVIFDDKSLNFDNYMNLYEFLEDLYGKKIDMLTPEQISPYMMKYIEKEVVFERL